jgi:hypothetical protein
VEREALLNAGPVRGTQSFVGVMSEVWRRPSLTAIELLWRGIAIAPVWLLFTAAVRVLGLDLHWNGFNPSAAPSSEQALALFQLLSSLVSTLLKPRVLETMSPFIVWWVAVAAGGRALILRRLAPQFRIRYGALFLMGLLRFMAATVVLVLWVAVCAFALNHFIWLPLTVGGEPNVVGGFALVVTSALLLFVAWCCVGWAMQGAPLYVMDGGGVGAFGALKAVLRNGALRSKLVEINMVMGIVTVCVLVLAMVFSASPLPFSAVETQSFLNGWWTGVAVLWVVASNYFHVVRSAAYLRLYEAFK